MTLTNVSMMEFPAVTVCNENPFRMSQIRKCDKRTGNLLQLQTIVSDKAIQFVREVSVFQSHVKIVHISQHEINLTSDDAAREFIEHRANMRPMPQPPQDECRLAGSADNRMKSSRRQRRAELDEAATATVAAESLPGF